MPTGTILVTGANGPVGAALSSILRKKYGTGRVIAADTQPLPPVPDTDEYYERLEPAQNVQLANVIRRRDITQLYHMQGFLPNESDPVGLWQNQIKSLLTVLEVARECNIKKIFWPAPAGDASSIPGMVRIAGEGWCAWYRVTYGMNIHTLCYAWPSSTDWLQESIEVMHKSGSVHCANAMTVC